MKEFDFRSFFEAAPDAVVVSDGSGGIVRVNAQAEALFGYTRAELVGEAIAMLVPDHDGAAHRRPATIGRRKDGSEFLMEIRIGPLQTDDGPLAITTIRDVTVR